MADNHYIPGIFNYCDSWCERCPFTHRCRCYDPRQSDNENDQGALLETIHKNLQEAMDLLRNHVEQQGFDWETFKQEAADAPVPDSPLTAPQKALVTLSTEYAQRARTWIDQHQAELRNRGDELSAQLEMGLNVLQQGVELAEALEVIQWYLFFIQVKLQRALLGLNDDFIVETDPVQNDANGSAKIALIAVENSMAAWEIVRERFPQHTNDIIDLLLNLARIQTGIEQTFPQVRHFIRPGFDEENP